jgi:hypothetical protein
MKEFKILNYIFIKVPKKAIDFTLGIPYRNTVEYGIPTTELIIKKDGKFFGVDVKEGQRIQGKMLGSERSKYIKPNTSIRYKILKYKLLNYIIIKQLNK